MSCLRNSWNKKGDRPLCPRPRRPEGRGTYLRGQSSLSPFYSTNFGDRTPGLRHRSIPTRWFQAACASGRNTRRRCRPLARSAFTKGCDASRPHPICVRCHAVHRLHRPQNHRIRLRARSERNQDHRELPDQRVDAGLERNAPDDRIGSPQTIQPFGGQALRAVSRNSGTGSSSHNAATTRLIPGIRLIRSPAGLDLERTHRPKAPYR